MKKNNPSKSYGKITVAVIALFLVAALIAGIFGVLKSTDVPAGLGSVSSSESGHESVVESFPPESEIEQPQPGELMPEDFRGLWLSDRDISESTDIDGLITPSKDTGITVVIADVSADTDISRLTEISAVSKDNEMSLIINLVSLPENKDELTPMLSAVDEAAAVFVPYAEENDDAFMTELRDFVRGNDGRCLFGITASSSPVSSIHGYADCVLVRPSFEEGDTVISSWGEFVQDTSVALYVGIEASAEEMQKDPRCLVRMQKTAFDTVNYRGTAVYGALNMYHDTTGAIDALISFLNGEENDYLTGELQIVEPTKTDYSTYGKVFTIRGNANPLYEMKINGEPVEIDQSGIFSWSCDLASGENEIIISHMGTTMVYNVTRKIDVIKSVVPAEKMYVDGGVILTLSAKALSGSTVTATLNGKKITLNEEEDPENEDGDGVYVKFSGLYTIPEGKEEEQNLGKITFKGIFDGYTESVSGGRIYVNPLPEPEPDKNVIDTIKVTASHLNGVNATKTYNPKYLDDKSAPTQYFLSTGMVDRIIKEVNFESEDGPVEAYLLSSGVLIHKEDCELIKREKISNVITSAALNEEGKHTVIRFKGTEPVAVIPSLSPLKFTEGHPLGYGINSFNADTVTILFSNTDAVSDILGFSENQLFSAYKWERLEDGQYKLVLTLKKKGGLYGIKTEIDSTGRVVISFKNPVKIKKADNEYGYSLEGVTVVLDAGHNGDYPRNCGAAGFYDGLHEANLNLMLAEKTKAILEDLGATVVMTRTDNKSDMTEDERVAKIISSNADLSIAIHHNGANRETAYGTSTFYFYPFSKDFSQSVYEELVNVYQTHIYTSGSKHEGCKEGCKYYPYYMTRIQEFPTILIEAGYITNKKEYEYLIRDDIQQYISEAFVKGIINYLEAQS